MPEVMFRNSSSLHGILRPPAGDDRIHIHLLPDLVMLEMKVHLELASVAENDALLVPILSAKASQEITSHCLRVVLQGGVWSNKEETMAFRLPGIRKASRAASTGGEVSKGYLAVYVGEKMKRFIIPISYLNQPSFQDLLSKAEEEFGYAPPMGGLTIPCTEDLFCNIISILA
ncbi:hypothetical protein PIB30_057476 [Stylosanthes scabra]|uniref:Small auxin up regulated protein n=1 Tax=Stylosanthes scabra TaxID=79078 RepID=A0ABU6SJM8_9FABA|nr:hypothetical protein [Stylosanthes scabra]